MVAGEECLAVQCQSPSCPNPLPPSPGNGECCPKCLEGNRVNMHLNISQS